MSQSDNRLEQLQRAVAAFVAWREDPGARDAEQFLAAHPELRELLEPMVHAAGGDVDCDEAPQVAVGMHLGDYELVRLLGRGGMGTVFEAQQVSLRRRVTVKVLHDELARTPAAVERFRTEASAAAGLRHPGIVPIFEVGEHAGVHFFAMEYVDGVPLDRMLRDGSLGDPRSAARHRRAATIVAELAEALAYAHRAGLVHHDVKPHNALVVADGSVRLLDFGLARDLGWGGGDDRRAGIVGTPHYMSPEQARGDEVGPAGDVFSCGIVLHELLTGERLFAGDSTSDVLRGIVDGPLPTPSMARQRVAADLVAIRDRCLQRDPAGRYPDAAALAADLRAWLRHEPITASRAGHARRAAGWLRRHPARAVVAVCVVFSLVALWSLDRTSAEAEAADAATLDAVRQLVGTVDDKLARQRRLAPEDTVQIDAVVALCDERLRHRTAPGLRRQLALALLDLARVYRRIGDPEPALRPIAGAIDAVAGDEDAAAMAIAARARSARAQVFLALGRHQVEAAADEAERAWRSVLAHSEWRSTARAALARLLVMRARLALGEADGIDRARRHLEGAQQQLANEEPTDERGWSTRCGMHIVEGLLQLQLEQPAEALAAFERAGELLAPATRDAATDLIAKQRLGVGTACVKLRRFADAARAFGEAKAAVVDVVERFPSDVTHRRTLATVHLQSGTLAVLRRDYSAASEELGTALAIWRELCAPDEPVPRDAMAFAVACTQLANCNLLQKAASPAAARELYEQALAVQVRLHDAAPDTFVHLTELGATHSNLAAWENQYGDAGEARGHARRAIELQQRAHGLRPDARRVRRFLGIHHAQLAHADEACGDRDAALQCARLAVDYAPAQPGTVRMCVETAIRCAAALATAGDAAAADAVHAECVRWLRRLSEAPLRNLEPFLRSPRFAALRDREDFRQLLGEVGR